MINSGHKTLLQLIKDAQNKQKMGIYSLEKLKNSKRLINHEEVIFKNVNIDDNNNIWLRGNFVDGNGWIKVRIKSTKETSFNWKSIKNKKVIVNGFWTKNGWTMAVQIWFNNIKIYQLEPISTFASALNEIFKDYNPINIDNFIKE